MEVASHVADCETCHGYVADLRALTAQMAQLGREPAPPGLEERIRALLSRSHVAEAVRPSVVPFPSRRRGFTQQAASLAAVCPPLRLRHLGRLTPSGRSAIDPSTTWSPHMVRSLLQNSTIQVVSSDMHTVRPWFNGKVEFAPPVKDLTAEGFPLAGGRLDFVDGHRVATLVYRHGPHTISVFVWPESAGTSGGGPLTQVDGLNVLSWTKDGMVWWAVSDMAPDELRELRALL